MGPRPLVLVSVLVLLGLPQDRAAAVATAPSTAGCDAVDDLSLSPARTTRAAQLCQGTWAQGADPYCAEDADVVGNHLDDGEVLLPAHVLWDDALLRDRRDLGGRCSLMDVLDSVRPDDLQEDDVRRVPRRAPAAGLVRPARLPRPRTSWSTLPRVAPAAPAASSWGGIASRPHLPVDDTPEDAPFQYRPPRPAASSSTPSPPPAPRWQDPFLQDEEGHVTRGGILLPPYRTEDIIATAPRSPRKSESRETPPHGSKPSASRWAAPESAAGRRQSSKGRAWPAAGTSSSKKPASSPDSSASRQPNARSTARRQASRESGQRAPDASAGKASNSVRAPSEPSAGQQPWPGSTSGREVSRESGQRAPDTSTGRTSTSRWEPSEPSGGRQPNTRSTAGRQQSAGGRRQTPPSGGGGARAPKSVSVEEELRKAWENIAAHRVNMPSAASPGRVKIKINVQQAQARPPQGRPPQGRPPQEKPSQQRAPALSAAEESRMLADLLIRLARRASEISSRLRDLAGTATAKKACSTAAASTSPGGRRPQQQQRRRRWDSTDS